MKTPILILTLAVLLAACNDDSPAPAQQLPPDVIRVDHILIGVEGAPRMPADRVDSLEQAKAKAYDLLAQVEEGLGQVGTNEARCSGVGPASPARAKFFLQLVR